MRFVNPALLAFLGALALPVLIHLIRARKFRPAELGTLRFLREALRETSARRRISDILLLILRLAAIAAAVFLFARPFMAEDTESPGRLVLVDASGSMAARSGETGAVSHFELALRRAKRFAAEAGPGRAQIWLCGETTREVTPDELERVASQVHPAGRVDWPSVLRRAAVACAKNTGPAPRVLILSDLQRRDLPDSVAELPRWAAATDIQIESLMAASWDAELVSASVGGRTKDGRDLAVTLAVHGRAPAGDLSLEVLVDGKRVAQVQAPAKDGTVHVVLPGEDRPQSLAEIHLVSGDRLPEDDRLWIPLAPPPPCGVWMTGLDDANPSRAETYFVNKALEVSGTDETFRPTVARVVGSALEPADKTVGEPRAVVLCDCSAREAAVLPGLAAKVREGTGLVLFLGSRADAAACRALAQSGLLPAEPKVMDSRMHPVAKWDQAHPCFQLYSIVRRELAPLHLVTHVDLTPLTQTEGRAKVLAKGVDNTPLVVETFCGKGRVLIIAASPTRTESDWPIQRAFAPLMRSWVDYVGATAPVISSGWRTEWRRFDESAGFGPDVATHTIRRFPPGEGSADTVAEPAFREALKLPERPAQAQAPQPATTADGALRPGEWWPWLIVALLAFATLETFLADRRTA